MKRGCPDRSGSCAALLVLLVLASLVLTSPAWAGDGFDLQSYRLRAAADRAAGIEEGRELLRGGVLDQDPHSRRLVLWYMGGAALGIDDEAALAEILSHLDAMAEQSGDEAAASYAAFLRAASLIDADEIADGLILTLEAANRAAVLEIPELRITAASELCRNFSGAGLSDRALEHCRRHVRLVRETGEIAALARAEYLEASALSHAGRAVEAVGRWRSARGHFLEAGQGVLAARTAGSLAVDLIELEQYEDALVMATEAQTAARETASPVSMAIASNVVANALLGLERLDEARAQVETVLPADDSGLPARVLVGLLRTQMRILEESKVDAVQVDAVAARLAVVSRSELDDSKTSDPELSSLESEYREREQQLRIRELETENRSREMALERVRMEVQRNEAALEHQRVVTWLASLSGVLLLAGLVALAWLLRSQRRLAEVLRVQARRDALTGIPNRRALVEAAQHLLESPGAVQHGHVLMMVDVDHFKQINDRHGHLFGDEVLIAITACMRRMLGTRGEVARMGGEEFALLCPDLGAEQAHALAEEIRHEVAALRLEAGGMPVGVSISMGVAVFSLDMMSFSAWLGAADAALYRAKELGRNQVEMAD